MPAWLLLLLLRGNMESLMDFLRSANDGLLGESFQSGFRTCNKLSRWTCFFVPCFWQVTVVPHVQTKEMEGDFLRGHARLRLKSKIVLMAETLHGSTGSLAYYLHSLIYLCTSCAHPTWVKDSRQHQSPLGARTEPHARCRWDVLKVIRMFVKSDRKVGRIHEFCGHE